MSTIIKVRCLHNNRFWLAGSESVVSLAGSFIILQTAVDSPYFGEAGNLAKTPVLCKNVIDFIYLFLKKWMFCQWDTLIVLSVSFQNVLFCGPHGLTFTWWGRFGLCFWHKPTELAHSFLSLFLKQSGAVHTVPAVVLKLFSVACV